MGMRFCRVHTHYQNENKHEYAKLKTANPVRIVMFSEPDSYWVIFFLISIYLNIVLRYIMMADKIS